MAFQEKYMRLAIELAKKGIGAVNPNPLVGAVIVRDDHIIGQGYHARYGDLHAERAALASLTEAAEGAHMYVTLEPCCHYGKQPPCVEAIVEHKIATVYVGSDDPNEKVAGKGIKYLREHGVEVHTQLLKDECDALNPVFFHYITTGTPYVVLKYAMSMDGKIAAYTGESKWISNELSRQRVQELRNEYSGIMVGIGTVLADDPRLTCRISGGRNPIRIVCDTELRIPVESTLVQTADEIPTIVAMGIEDDGGHNEKYKTDGESETEKNRRMEKEKILTEKGVTVLHIPCCEGVLDLRALMRELGSRNIDSILLEGGGTLSYSAVMAGIVNEVQAFVAPKILGGRSAITPVEGQGVETPDLAQMFELQSVEQLGDDLYIRYKAR
ncbi:MAG: bifunctional diaminohydroxyphosphoribosylaminopyrimidine deaminase/5-amino-6-(5-phosphoribosylamino)uracil reductase RibD [Wujia sp.]